MNFSMFFPCLSVFIFGIIFLSHAQTTHTVAIKYYMYAEKLKSFGHIEEALNFYDMAIVADSNNYKFYYNKGICHMKMYQPDTALVSFKKVVALQKDCVAAYRRMAWIYQNNFQHLLATAMLDSAFTYAHNATNKVFYKIKVIRMLHRLGGYDETISKHLEEALAVAPDALHLLYYCANHYNKRGLFEKAKENVLKALELLKTDRPAQVARYYYELGFAYHNLGAYALARQAFERANYGIYKKKIAEMMPKFYYHMATAYHKIYDFAHAQTFIDICLEIDSTYVYAHELQLKLARLNIDRSAVIENQKKTIALTSDSQTKAKRYEDLAHIQFLDKRLLAAIVSADSCLSISPENHRVIFVKAIALYKLNQPLIAITELKKVIQKHGFNFEIKARFNFALGIIYKQVGDFSNADHAFKRASYGIFRTAALKEHKYLREILDK